MIKISSENDSKIITFNWQLSKFCEKSCHYCTSSEDRKSLKGDKSLNFYSNSELIIHDKILGFLKGRTNSTINLYGGEPTLHPKGIEYFLSLCDHYKNDSSTFIFLTTHGDIDDDKIENLCNNISKKEHMLSISYHMYQVNFQEWLQKILKFNKSCNVLVSAIIPRSNRSWDEFEKNINILIDKKINVELKGEFNKELEVDNLSIIRFQNLINKSEQLNKVLCRDNLKKDIIFSENKNILKILSYQDRLNSAINLSPIKTICQNRQFGISSKNIFSASCSEGNFLEITNDTIINEFNKYLKLNSCITCTRKSCSENRHDMNTMFLF